MTSNISDELTLASSLPSQTGSSLVSQATSTTKTSSALVASVASGTSNSGSIQANTGANLATVVSQATNTLPVATSTTSNSTSLNNQATLSLAATSPTTSKSSPSNTGSTVAQASTTTLIAQSAVTATATTSKITSQATTTQTPTNPIDNTIAGQIIQVQLSQASYVPLSQYQSGNYPSLPTGWYVDIKLSGQSNDGKDQFIVFYNPSTQQAVVTFKGSNNRSDYWSDATNSGANAWSNIKQAVANSMPSIMSNYSGYQIVTDGQSLGGGDAQTCSLLYGLSGYGQNSLPVAPNTISSISNFSTLYANWLANGNTFSEDNVKGDPATNFYSGLLNQFYLDPNPTTIDSPYAAEEVLDLLMGDPLGAAEVAYQAHLLGTQLSLLQNNPTETTSSGTNPALVLDANTLISQYGSGSFTANSDGSVTYTAADGTNVTISNTTANGVTTYSVSGNDTSLISQLPASMTVTGNNQATANFSGGYSVQESLNPSSGVSDKVSYFSGLNGTGTLEGTDILNTSGAGQVTSANGQNSFSYTAYQSPTISLDASGNPVITLQQASGTGLSQIVDLSNNGVQFEVGGGMSFSAPVGSTLTENSSGAFSIATTPTSGWTDTTNISASDVITQTYASTAPNGQAISETVAQNSNGDWSLSNLVMAGQNFVNSAGTNLNTFVNNTINSLNTTVDAAAQSLQQNSLLADANAIVTDTFTNVSNSVQSFLQSYATDYSASAADQVQDTSDLESGTYIENYIAYSNPYISVTAPDDPTISDPGYGNWDDGSWDDGSWDDSFGTGDDSDDDYDDCSDDDPLVLSVNGNGINLTSIAQSNAQFDFVGNGVKEATGWIGANTGFLVLMSSTNTTNVTASNMLTFSNLATLDSNHDGVINAQDPAFANLRVWVDTNGDGISQFGELYTLAQLGIKSINVASTSEVTDVNGNVITAVGSLTFTNGTTEAVDDVVLASISSSGIQLSGQSSAALSVLKRTLNNSAANANGTAAADQAAITTALNVLTAPATVLTYDETHDKPTFDGTGLDATKINATTSLEGFIDVSNQIWSTNGTASGTGQILSGTSPFSFALGNGKSIFVAVDGNGKYQLYATNGDTKGCGFTEIGWVTPWGLKPTNFTSLGNGKYLFTGNDTNPVPQLWVTDGTLSGTIMLTEVWYTVPFGLAGYTMYGLGPSNFTSLGNGKVLFTGNVDGLIQLWVTDGTKAGTLEIGSMNNWGLNPSNFVAFGNGKMLFEGYDKTDGLNSEQLWVTDGTAAGTLQLTTPTPAK